MTNETAIAELLDSDLSDLDAIERKLLAFSQAECPVAHHFGPGIYIRECSMPTGSVVLGHYHKTDHMNIMLKGVAALYSPDGSFTIVTAPMILSGKPGRKLAYVIEDMVWLNVYSTDERDIDTLERMFMEKSEHYCKYEHEMQAREAEEKKEDREDFLMLEMQTEEDGELDGWSSSILRVYDSPIHGRGVFTSVPIIAGSIIGPAKIGKNKTILGRYANHSKNPNCRFVYAPNGDMFMMAMVDISGCLGGGKGSELTVDYRNTAQLAQEEGAKWLE